jgi:hypothetical protein
MSTVLTHGGFVHPYPQAKLKALWEIAAPRLGYSQSAIRYLSRLIGLTSRQDYEPDSICVVFHGSAKLSVKIDMARRSLNRAESQFSEDGWIVKTCPGRGQRHGDRETSGQKKIRWGAGINLGPLIDRAAELQEIADKVEAERLAMQSCRMEINAIRREMIVSGFEAEALEAYPRGRPSEVTCYKKLKAILTTLRTAHEEVLRIVRQPSSPTGSAKTVRPITIHEPKLFESTRQKTGGTGKPNVDLSSLAFVASESLKNAVDTYSNRHDPLSALSMACRDRCSDLGISQRRWTITETKFGIPLAALFIAVIDHNAQRPETDKYFARDPQKCLSGMTWRYARGKLNFAGMIAEIKRSVAKNRRLSEGSKVTLVATPPHLVREGVLRPFPSTPTHFQVVPHFSEGIAYVQG